ncbi:MAG: universal stress protein [Actinomycetota bacterium]|nr:universal stress protein [Actinomycetota bacterium]
MSSAGQPRIGEPDELRLEQLTGLILGSVPHELVHRSSVPVLIVPLPDG